MLPLAARRAARRDRPAPVSRTGHSAAAHRPRPPAHEHVESGPAGVGGRSQVLTRDPSMWTGPGTTMLDIIRALLRDRCKRIEPAESLAIIDCSTTATVRRTPSRASRPPASPCRRRRRPLTFSSVERIETDVAVADRDPVRDQPPVGSPRPARVRYGVTKTSLRHVSAP